MKRDNITKNAISEPSPTAYSRAQTVNEDRMALVWRSSRIHDANTATGPCLSPI